MISSKKKEIQPWECCTLQRVCVHVSVCGVCVPV